MQYLDFMPADVRARACATGDRLTAIRLRPGKRIQLTFPGGDELIEMLSPEDFRRIVSLLMSHSLYACQSQLDMAYFTLKDGSRAGVCGRFSANGPRSIEDIGSVCIRISREINGCADRIIDSVRSASGTLIVSPPGMGKTTLLREIARKLSEEGMNVCISDERGELAACTGGIPTLDVGPRTDVISGCPKHRAMMLVLRSCAPDVIVTDEIGGPADSAAIGEVLRCGVRLVASAHGDTLDASDLRPCIAELINSKVFDLGILLGPTPGHIAGIRFYNAERSESNG